MSRRDLKPLFLMAALSSAACPWGEDGVARLNELHPPPTPPPAADGGPTCPLPNQDGGVATDPDGSCLGLLSGQWAARLVEFGNISPLGPPAWDVTITNLFLVQLSSDHSSLQLTFCGEENTLTDDTGVAETLGQNSVPPALVSGLAATPLTVPLPTDGGAFQADQVAWLWGVRGLTNPATNPLPTTADAGSVWDQDMDGNPGVTVDVANPAGELYLVKRALFDFEQGNVSQSWVTGPLRFTLEQNPLGASNLILTTPAPITPRSECTSVYQLRCVDSTFTCASLVQGYQSLFVNAPN